MSLDEIRDRARASIHERFSIPAVVRSEGGVEIPVTARLHRDLKKPFGDLDREGFALMMEYHNEVIIDRTEWEPVENYTIDFDRGRVYEIVLIKPSTGERYVNCQVTAHE